jgi:hypothetical protein
MTMSMNGRGSARQGATSRRREVSGWPQVARDSASRLSSPAVEDADLKDLGVGQAACSVSAEKEQAELLVRAKAFDLLAEYCPATSSEFNE